MTHAKQFTLSGWRLVLADIGINATHVLRRASLPEDLFARADPRLDTPEYFALWRALTDEADDPLLPLRIVGALSMEAFDPAVFAAACSPDLNTALQRVSAYKRLIAPMRLRVDISEHTTALDLLWIEATSDVPPALVAAELLFFVQLARMATRARIAPLRVITPSPPEPCAAYREFFGVAVETGDSHTVIFSAGDAARPFLSENEAMWAFFEPELRRRLAQLEANASTEERMHAALLELLPSGLASAEAVATKLGMSKRTLQRRLSAESETFQAILDRTREGLARHYLATSAMSGAEISFLLGYEDPNSFFRAFHAWTGDTPERVRTSLRH